MVEQCAEFVVVQASAGHTTLVVSGEIDMSSAPDPGRFLHQVINQAAAKHQPALTLDLSGVSFFSAAGVRILLQVLDSADRLGLSPLWRLSPAVDRLLVITGTRQLLDDAIQTPSPDNNRLQRR